ncbi:MAG TPA: DUF502 domain-containing protein [Verrucomicrobiae bacterium]|nr:DUF502 domain-containing protein [Verrucomicrobiae bacterium]
MQVFFARWKVAFLTGLAVILPAAVSVAIVIWMFGVVSHFTNTLLVFVPSAWMQTREGVGLLYWNLLALAAAILLISLAGGIARYYFGRKLIQLVDRILLRVPLFNKLYRLMKRVNEALTANQANTFKQVVLVEFPRPGLYALGFLTSMHNDEMRARSHKPLVSVFVPAPPLTSGSVVLVPEADVIKLEMSVPEGIKFIMSLGAVSPSYGDAFQGKEGNRPATGVSVPAPALLEPQTR